MGLADSTELNATDGTSRNARKASGSTAAGRSRMRLAGMVHDVGVALPPGAPRVVISGMLTATGSSSMRSAAAVTGTRIGA